MIRPVVFMAFANQQKMPFLDLSKEDEGMYGLFVNGKDSQALQIHRDQYTSTRELIQYLQKFKDQVSLFHFGGHAASANLFLEDTAAREQGLAALLGKQPHLRCAFLNGCNTKGLVDQLLEAGVPVVIATDREVDNDQAVQLALDFYTHLTGGGSIKESFQASMDAFQTVSEKSIGFRGLKKRPKPATEEGIPWGIYYSDEKALDWKLSQATSDVQYVSKHFWLRFVVLLVAIFWLFTWSNRHIGTSSTTFFLTNGPLALLGIGAFILKAMQGRSPGLTNFFERFSYFVFRAPALIAICTIVLAISLVGSSVVVKHAGGEPLKLELTDPGGGTIPNWQIDGGNVDQSRLFVISPPFSGKMHLNVPGYHPIDFKLKAFLGKRIPIDSLNTISSLLIRLPMGDIQFAHSIKIRIEGTEGEPLEVEMAGKAALLIGPDQTIPDQLKKAWKEELISSGQSSENLAQIVVNRWTDTGTAVEAQPFNAGKQLTISKLRHDSVIFSKQITLLNQKVNDVLLKE